MKKAYFQYYETFETILSKIKDAEEREFMRKIIINYGLYGTEPESFYSESMEMAWTICRELIDQQRHRRETNAANRKKTTNEESSEIEPLQDPQTEEKKAEEKKKKFKKPTVEEIAAYCKEKGYSVNAQQFFNYYESNGWKIGRNSMKSWQAAVQNWNAREKNNKTIWNNQKTDANTERYEEYF